MLLTLFVFAAYFAVKAVRSANNWYLLGAGACTGLALLTKGTANLLYLIVPLAYLVKGPAEKGLEKSRPLARWLVASFMAMVFAFGILNLLRFSSRWAQRSHFIATRTKVIKAALTTPPSVILRFVGSIAGNLWTYLTPVLLVLAVGGLALALAKRWRPGYFLLAWTVLAVGVISLVGKFAWARFYLVLVPPLLWAGGYALYQLALFAAGVWDRAGRRTLLASGSFVVIGVLVVAVALPAGAMMDGMARATRGESEYLKGRCNGKGMEQTARLLDEASKHGKINVVVNDYFIQYALQMYLTDQSRIEWKSLDLQYRLGYTDNFKSAIAQETIKDPTWPTYVIVNGVKDVPAGWGLQIVREFKKDNGRDDESMYVTRVSNPAGLISRGKVTSQ